MKISKENRLSAVGFNLGQVQTVTDVFASRPDVAKIGAKDAKTEKEAVEMVNALKARLNELIEALKA